jgi:GntR family transcriptional regulator/MocR family aminotransferase
VFIETGALDRHIRRMAARYAERRRALLAAVARHLPGWSVTGIAAGLHAVLVPERPLPPDALDAMAHAPDGMGAIPLAAYAQAIRPRPGLVVGYGSVTTDRIDRGIAAMARATP